MRKNSNKTFWSVAIFLKNHKDFIFQTNWYLKLNKSKGKNKRRRKNKNKINNNYEICKIMSIILGISEKQIFDNIELFFDIDCHTKLALYDLAQQIIHRNEVKTLTIHRHS